MVKCPQCNKKIDCLNYKSIVEHVGVFNVDIGGVDWFNEDDAQGDYLFYCPECNALLFEDDYNKAKEFLKGGNKEDEESI